MNFELGGKIMTKFLTLGPKTYSYLTDDNDKNKKAEGTLKHAIKGKHKFEDFKHCLEPTQLEKKKENVGKKFNLMRIALEQVMLNSYKNNKLILKSQQIRRSRIYNVFNEEVNKIVISANQDKRMQPIDSIERYAYGKIKKLVCKKEEIKCNNIIK